MRNSIALACLFLFAPTLPAASSVIGGRISPDGREEIGCDLPGSEHLKNTGGLGPRGPGTGAGLCVFTSIEHCGRYQNETALIGLQKKMTSEPGGGYPDKVDAMLKKYAPKAIYIQYTGKDTSLLKLAIKTSRMVGVTYGYSPRYGGPIAHMVNLVHLSDQWACVLDNNFPGENYYEWMSPDEFDRRWVAGSPDKSGWAVILLNPPPPPSPHNNVTPHTDSSESAAQARVGRRPLLALRTQKETQFMFHTLFFATLLVPGGWGADFCGLVSPDAERSADDYQWQWRPSDPGRYYLFKNDVQIGGYDIWFDYYRAYDARAQTWGPKEDKPPIPPPNKHTAASRERQRPENVENYGVDYSEFPSGEACTINGRKTTKDHAKRLIEGKGDHLADDSRKLRLTIFGSETERDAVVLGLTPAQKDALSIQAYPPDHWIVGQRRFKIGAQPTIYLESPAGTVLHRQEGWDGPESLAKVLERADPNYDPSKDPDLRKPKPQSTPTPDVTPAPVTSTCPDWALHIVNTFVTAVSMIAIYLFTQGRPQTWTQQPSPLSYR
jgi:hypothetical protein